MIIFSSIKKIWSYLNRDRKHQLTLLLVLMIGVSIAEVISIGAVVPFLGALSNSEIIFKHDLTQPIIQIFNISNHKELLLPITIIFIIASIFAGLMRIILLWVQTRVAHGIGADLGYDVYQSALQQPYEDHISRNSSEIISAISIKVNQIVAQIIKPIMIIISSFLIFTVMISFLIYLNPILSISTLTGFAFIYAIVIFLTRRRLLENSTTVNTKTNLVIKLLQEGLGGIRNIILDDLLNLYTKSFHHEDVELRRAIGYNQIVSQSPRFGVEALGMVLIAIVAYNMSDNYGNFIPVLGAFALGAQRILPLLQQSYSSWSSIYGSQMILREVMSYVEIIPKKSKKTLKTNNIAFKKSIKLNDLSFNYKNRETNILKGINIEIIKGSRVGIIGETGSGKSTLLDIIMCLLFPIKGTISIDGVEINLDNSRGWQEHLAHIPQHIFLIDDTITRNIAFGIPSKEIDHDRVLYVAKQAGISDTIELLDLKYESIVGERGTRLSGGQRQRIGIARALYKKSDVIIFDEATSALDEKTENSVMTEIYKIDKDITMIMVSHRISSMKNCDLIYELAEGKVKWYGTHAELVIRDD